MQTFTDQDIRIAVDEIQAVGLEEFSAQDPIGMAFGPLSHRSSSSSRRSRRSRRS